MGDNGHMYVDKHTLPAYKDHIIPLATVLTPNQYEAELLTGTKIDSKASAVAACETLHERGIATVVRSLVAAIICIHMSKFSTSFSMSAIQRPLHSLNISCLPWL